MAKAGTITVKLELDTTEAKAKLAELRKEAEGLSLSPANSAEIIESITFGGIGAPSSRAVDIERRLRGVRLSSADSEYLITAIKARTY